MSGVDFGVETPNEPTNTDNEVARSRPNWVEAARSFHARKATKPATKTRIQRRYTIIRRKDGITRVQRNIHQSYASRLKNQYRSKGYLVDMIEECSLTGEIVRYPESTDKIPTPTPYVTNMQKSRALTLANKMASLRAMRMSRENAIANSHRDKDKALVYDKVTSRLVYSGGVENAIDFIFDHMDVDNWVIYLPEEIWRKNFGVVND